MHSDDKLYVSTRTRGPDRVLRWAFAAAGLFLTGLAIVANYTSYITNRQGNVFFRLPRTIGGLSGSFSVWWVVAGLPLVLFAIGWVFPAFRTAVLAPWRRSGKGRVKDKTETGGVIRTDVSSLASSPFTLSMAFILFLVTMTPVMRLWTSQYPFWFYTVVAASGFILLLVGAYPWLRFLDAPVEQLEQWVMGMDRRLFMLLLFGFMFLAANAISWFVFRHSPFIFDSTAQLFQARIFASGRLFLSSPPFPGFFDYMNVINNGQWYSQYPYLHSLLMVPFVLLGVPWLTNPLLGALTVPLIYLLGRELYGERTGRFAGLLACLSPFIFNMSAEFMNHATALLFCTLFLLFFFRTLRAGRWVYPVVAGAAIGLVANVRPFTALMFAAPFAVYGLYRVVREPGRHFSRFLLMAGCAAAVTGLALLYNWLTNGDPLLWGYIVNWGPGHEVGFGRSGWGPLHTPQRGLNQVLASLNLLNRHMFFWPIPSLLPTALLFASGARDRRDRLLLAGVAGLVLTVFLYWFHADSLGPRFLYESAGCLVILTVRGIEELGPFLRRTCGLQTTDRAVGRFVRRVWPAMTVFMLGVALPPLYRSVHSQGGGGSELVHAVRKAGLTNALVFCRSFGDAFNSNTLGLDGNVVYARDLGFFNPALTIAYPGRKYFYGNRDTVRPLEDIAYPHSQLKRALDEIAAYLNSTATNGYRTVLWPFKGIPVPEPGSETRFISLDELSLVSATNRQGLDFYLPALACWIVGSERIIGYRRQDLAVLSLMSSLQDTSAEGLRFKLLMETIEGTGAVFEITRDEPVFP